MKNILFRSTNHTYSNQSYTKTSSISHHSYYTQDKLEQKCHLVTKLLKVILEYMKTLLFSPEILAEHAVNVKEIRGLLRAIQTFL